MRRFKRYFWDSRRLVLYCVSCDPNILLPGFYGKRFFAEKKSD